MTRTLGRTGLSLSTLTLGTGGIGAAGCDRDEARAAFAMAIDAGVNAIELAADDAAAIDLVAEVLRAAPSRRAIHLLLRPAPGVPLDLPSPHILADAAYPGAALCAQVEATLRRLGIERIALVQLHAWCAEWLHEGDWRETLAALRAEGKVAGTGVSTFDHDADAALEAVDRQAIDAVTVLHNIFDPLARARLMPLAQARGVGVIVRAPLYYGALAQPPFAGGGADWRAAYFYPAHRAETTARARAVAETVGMPLAAAAIRFCLTAPAPASVVVGMRTRAHVAANLAAAAAGPLDPDSLDRLRAHRWLC